jgi:RNA polymerase sigma-70 factor (ECF subfamily)
MQAEGLAEMEPDTASCEDEQIASTNSSKRQLVEFLTEHTGPVLGTIRSYVQRMGLASGAEVPAVALEVLQETAIEALQHADRFRPTGQPMAWLLGIAINIIRRKKAEQAKRAQRELSIARFSSPAQEALSENELFDQVVPQILAGPEQDIEANEQALALLSLVSPEDQQVLRLALLYEFEREALAQALGTTPGAARVRLHRALNRLRSAWREQQISLSKGADHD